jgi:endogenous inhibitor of DNA gyrase (YacG/DUF329 family)
MLKFIKSTKTDLYMKFTCPRCKSKFERGEKADKSQGLPRYFPFCSERCRLIDLGAWVESDYKIASTDHGTGLEK